ncbi:hypothetical protein [Saccharothrix deserti]|uniref:hypothetical protein n=1 Tax=Saccharothrix deserti TaxID=2593674 RepID=UPI001EE451C1|nr:hypothetical protein [Saccharothrix deserti]
MRNTLSLLALGVSVTLVVGCGSSVTPNTPANSSANAGQAVTITNCGRDVTVDGAPSAAVGLSPSQTALLLRLASRTRSSGRRRRPPRRCPTTWQAWPPTSRC